jgi:uncharacterized protein YeaO (DUF488 family)
VRAEKNTLTTRRVYAPAGDNDGSTVLVDRLWPRGVAKADDRVALWLRDIAPSDALRKQFHGNPAGWDAFVAAYAAELATPAAGAAVDRLRQLMQAGPVTLLYASRDEAHNNAVALKAWLERN